MHNQTDSNAGVAPPPAPDAGFAALDTIGREMLQIPGLLDLVKNLERHPHYPLVKLKQQMAQRGASVLRNLDATPARSLGAATVANRPILNQAVRAVARRRGDTPCERLAKLWETEEGKVRLRTAEDIKTIAALIGKGLTVTKASTFFKSVIAPARKAYKSLLQYEKQTARDRAGRAEERDNARGERRRRNRPRNRPTK